MRTNLFILFVLLFCQQVCVAQLSAYYKPDKFYLWRVYCGQTLEETIAELREEDERCINEYKDVGLDKDCRRDFRTKRVKRLEIVGLDYRDSIGDFARLFPNVKELRIVEFRELYDLQGIENFKKLKSLLILPNEHYDFVLSGNFSRIYTLDKLEKLVLGVQECDPGVNSNILYSCQNYDSIVNLKRLKIFCNTFDHIELKPQVYFKLDDLEYITDPRGYDYQKHTETIANDGTYIFSSEIEKIYFTKFVDSLNYAFYLATHTKNITSLSRKFLGEYEWKGFENYKKICDNPLYEVDFRYANGNPAIKGQFEYGNFTGKWNYYTQNGDSVIVDFDEPKQYEKFKHIIIQGSNEKHTGSCSWKYGNNKSCKYEWFCHYDSVNHVAYSWKLEYFDDLLESYNCIMRDLVNRTTYVEQKNKFEHSKNYDSYGGVSRQRLYEYSYRSYPCWGCPNEAESGNVDLYRPIIDSLSKQIEEKLNIVRMNIENKK